MFNSGGTLGINFIHLFILTQMCTKKLVKMCAKFWKNMFTGFRFMDFG